MTITCPAGPILITHARALVSSRFRLIEIDSLRMRQFLTLGISQIFMRPHSKRDQALGLITTVSNDKMCVGGVALISVLKGCRIWRSSGRGPCDFVLSPIASGMLPFSEL